MMTPTYPIFFKSSFDYEPNATKSENPSGADLMSVSTGSADLRQPLAISGAANPDEIVNRLLYRDALILVLDKPAGIAVHTANGGMHNLERHFSALQFGLPNPPTLGHRLDRGTSGCLVLARHREAARRLGVLFAENRIKKTYWAVVRGNFPTGDYSQEEGRIDLPLSKQSESKKQWWMKVDLDGGVSAITDYRVLGRGEGLTWLELSPQTGRTHQLRVHCAALGHPILGDYIYDPCGEPSAKEDLHLHLHARSLEIPLYPKKAPISIEAAPPPHMQGALKACGYLGSIHICKPTP